MRKDSSSSSSSSEEEVFVEAKEVNETSQVEQQGVTEEGVWRDSLNQAWIHSLGETGEVPHNIHVTDGANSQLTAVQVSQQSYGIDGDQVYTRQGTQESFINASSQVLTTEVSQESCSSNGQVSMLQASQESSSCTSDRIMTTQVSQESCSSASGGVLTMQLSQESFSSANGQVSKIQVSRESSSNSESVTTHGQYVHVVSSSRTRRLRSSSSSSLDNAEGNDRISYSRKRKSTGEYSSQESDGDGFRSSPLSPVNTRPPVLQHIIKESASSCGSADVDKDPPPLDKDPVLDEMKFELGSWPSRSQSVRMVKVTAHQPALRTMSHDSSRQSIYTGLMERHIKELKGKGVQT